MSLPPPSPLSHVYGIFPDIQIRSFASFLPQVSDSLFFPFHSPFVGLLFLVHHALTFNYFSLILHHLHPLFASNPFMNC